MAGVDVNNFVGFGLYLTTSQIVGRPIEEWGEEGWELFWKTLTWRTRFKYPNGIGSGVLE